MDVKSVLQDVEGFILDHPDLSEALQLQLRELAETFQQQRRHLKQLSNEKGTVARLFRQAEQTSRAELIEQMSAISARVKACEQSLRALQQDGQTLLQETETSTPPSLPAIFLPRTDVLGQTLTARWLSDCDAAGYESFLQNHPDYVHACQLPGVLNSIERSFGYTSDVLLACHGQDIVGALPIIHIHSRLFGNNSVALPYFNYGNPITRYHDVATFLIGQYDAVMTHHNCQQIELRTTLAHLNPQLTCIEKKISMVLALPSDDSTLDAQLGTKVRAQVNRALEHAPEIRIGHTELLDDFYRVFAVNMRDLGTPVYSKRWFRTLLQNSDPQTHLVVCYVKQRPVATAFLMGHGDLLEIPWASTLRSANQMNMNMWMYRQILGFAIHQGYTFFDFGRSTKGASTYRFKKQWGARPVEHFWYYRRADGQTVTPTNPDNPKYRLLIAVWQRLPVWFTRLIGPPIVQQIP